MKEFEINALRNEALHDQRKIEDGRGKIDMNKSTVFDVKIDEDISIHDETFDSGASVHTDPGIGRAANTLRNKAITDEIPRPTKVYPGAMADCDAVKAELEALKRKMLEEKIFSNTFHKLIADADAEISELKQSSELLAKTLSQARADIIKMLGKHWLRDIDEVLAKTKKAAQSPKGESQ